MNGYTSYGAWIVLDRLQIVSFFSSQKKDPVSAAISLAPQHCGYLYPLAGSVFCFRGNKSLYYPISDMLTTFLNYGSTKLPGYR